MNSLFIGKSMVGSAPHISSRGNGSSNSTTLFRLEYVVRSINNVSNNI